MHDSFFPDAALRPHRQSGRALILIVAVALPLFGFLGLVVDGVRAHLNQERLQKALSLAAVHAETAYAAAGTAADAEAKARAAMEETFGRYYVQDDDPLTPPLVPKLWRDDEGKIQLRIENPLPAYFMGVIGVPVFKLRAVATLP